MKKNIFLHEKKILLFMKIIHYRGLSAIDKAHNKLTTKQ